MAGSLPTEYLLLQDVYTWHARLSLRSAKLFCISLLWMNRETKSVSVFGCECICRFGKTKFRPGVFAQWFSSCILNLDTDQLPHVMPELPRVSFHEMALSLLKNPAKCSISCRSTALQLRGLFTASRLGRAGHLGCWASHLPAAGHSAKTSQNAMTLGWSRHRSGIAQHCLRRCPIFRPTETAWSQRPPRRPPCLAQKNIEHVDTDAKKNIDNPSGK